MIPPLPDLGRGRLALVGSAWSSDEVVAVERAAVEAVDWALASGSCAHHVYLRMVLTGAAFGELRDVLDELPCCGPVEAGVEQIAGGSEDDLLDVIDADEDHGQAPSSLHRLEDLLERLYGMGFDLWQHQLAGVEIWCVERSANAAPLPTLFSSWLEALARSAPGEVRALARMALGEIAPRDLLSPLAFAAAQRLRREEDLPEQGGVTPEQAMPLLREALVPGRRWAGGCALGLGLCGDHGSAGRLRELVQGTGDERVRWGALAGLTLLEPGAWLPLIRRICYRAALPGLRPPATGQDALQRAPRFLEHLRDETIFPYRSPQLEQLLGALADETLFDLLHSTLADCRVEAAIELTRRGKTGADQHEGDLGLCDARDVVRLLDAAICAEQVGQARGLVRLCLKSPTPELRLAGAAVALLALGEEDDHEDSDEPTE